MLSRVGKQRLLALGRENDETYCSGSEENKCSASSSRRHKVSKETSSKHGRNKNRNKTNARHKKNEEDLLPEKIIMIQIQSVCRRSCPLHLLEKSRYQLHLFTEAVAVNPISNIPRNTRVLGTKWVLRAADGRFKAIFVTPG